MGHVSATFTQAGYRWRNDDGNEATATYAAALNTPVTLETATVARCRIHLDETAGGAENNVSTQWQYQHNSGGWVNVTTSSSVVRAVTSTQGSLDATATTQQISAGTFVSAEVTEDGLSDAVRPSFAGNEDTELELVFQIIDADVADTDTLELRVVRADLTTFTTYSQTPSLTVSKVAGGTVHDMTGTLAGAGSLSGDLTPRRVLAGSLAGVGSLSGDLIAIRALAGSISGVGTFSGNLEKVSASARELSGTLTGTASLSGDLTAIRDLSGTIQGQGSFSGDLVLRRVLVGTITGAGSMQGPLLVTRDLAGTVAGVGSLSGNLTIAEAGVHDMTATLTGVASLSGDLTARRALVGDLTGSGTLTGELVAIRVLSGTLDGSGSLSGLLTVAGQGVQGFVRIELPPVAIARMKAEGRGKSATGIEGV